MARKMGKENIKMQMDQFLMGCGEMGKDMEKVY